MSYFVDVKNLENHFDIVHHYTSNLNKIEKDSVYVYWAWGTILFKNKEDAIEFKLRFVPELSIIKIAKWHEI